MRLATWNVLSGRSLADGTADAALLAECAASLDADVLALQEVDRAQARSGGADQAAAVAEAVGATDWRFVPALYGTPGETWRRADEDDAGGTAYGIALFSRLPVSSWRTLRLPRVPRVGLPMPMPGSRRWRWVPDEPRVAVCARVAAPFGDVTVAATHLSFIPAWNAWQLRYVVSALRRLPGPYLLMGDLNLPGPLPRVFAGWECLARGATFPAPSPHVQLDHVLASPGLDLDVRGCDIRELALSDHRAVVVEVA
ncbi:MAG TPA: endonuclease/exonuclease/phosphatase family protein [Frankiaceae bacterium]|nr:endonuclease/exonuclease/phosphatase family protein [Frankiaceae bacterium]